MNLSHRDQALLVVLIVIVTGFTFCRLTYLPVYREIQTITASNQQLLMEKKRLQMEGQKPSVITTQTQDEFNKRKQRLPVEDEMIPLLIMLDKTTAKYNLPIASLDYRGSDKPDETGAQNLIFTLGTKGKISRLFNFLHELENAERLISVEDVSFTGAKQDNQQTTEADEGLPTYYITPPGIPEAKLQRIKIEVAEEKQTAADSERPVAASFQPDVFEMKLTIKAFYANQGKAAKADTDVENKSNKSGEV